VGSCADNNRGKKIATKRVADFKNCFMLLFLVVSEF